MLAVWFTHCPALQVLNVINFAEADLLADNPALADAHVMVHLSSHVEVSYCTALFPGHAACLFPVYKCVLIAESSLCPDTLLAFNTHDVMCRHTMRQCYGESYQTAAAGSHPHNGAEPEMLLPPSPH